MGVDHEIDVINQGIASVYEVIFKLNHQLDSTLLQMNDTLTDLDFKINDAVARVAGVEEDIVNVTNYFPLAWLYYLILIFIIVLLDALAVYLMFHIYRLITQRSLRTDKEIRKYNKTVYSRLPMDDRNDFSLEDIETPPPTYDEYVTTADLYVNYHRNGNFSSSITPEYP